MIRQHTLTRLLGTSTLGLVGFTGSGLIVHYPGFPWDALLPYYIAFVALVVLLVTLAEERCCG